ncbi:polyhydroxyalkanoate depolymerase [Jeongeupella avenae]|uniref:Polyhydroxyalkanoate depolymerase n=1 Tax=Antarcticirhabdus aurantiaca TaxID=2606717 RepID=A0ACD4NNY5_9HYPH|nr:polyhydroxyalkanoate depolymerase [Antarcticirhabdus aurantiaca]WAJ28526.1 polyhydroxyalkanoate depolymerase [Jeongeuplla avenae]
MLYQFYEWNHAALAPLRAIADATRLFYQNPLNPLSRTEAGRAVAAMAELFERTTRVYGKPEFGLHETVVGGLRVPVQDKAVWEKPFCRLLHFERALPEGHKKDPRFLVVAPMSGHYATLLRGTVEALLPYAEVYITDWTDARMVPLAQGRFDLDDYVDYVIEMLHVLGPDTHVIGVCQPAVPVLMAAGVMAMDEDSAAPATMTLMGGPIDTRSNPTAVNQLAKEKGIDWFRENVIMPVPFPHPGFMRRVYPGFLQLSGFMSMNLDRHLIAHKDFFWHLVKDDGDSAEKHRSFYDEYNAVMDMTAEFYLQTVEEVFIKHSLPKGTITHRGRRIDLTAIRTTALLTIEGENDDISGVGQTEAAQDLCTSIPAANRVHYVQPKVGHYGVFNGSRYRAEIAPRILDFALTHGTTHSGAAQPRPLASASAPIREGAVKERKAKAAALRRGGAGELGLGEPAAASVQAPATVDVAEAALPVEPFASPRGSDGATDAARPASGDSAPPASTDAAVEAPIRAEADAEATPVADEKAAFEQPVAPEGADEPAAVTEAPADEAAASEAAAEVEPAPVLLDAAPQAPVLPEIETLEASASAIAETAALRDEAPAAQVELPAIQAAKNRAPKIEAASPKPNRRRPSFRKR